MSYTPSASGPTSVYSTDEDDMPVVYYPLGTAERHELEERILAEAERNREERRREAVAAKCTFQPHIDGHSDSIVKKKQYHKLGNGDVSERLLERAAIAERERLRLQHEHEAAEAIRLSVEAPFRPAIDPTSERTSQRMFQDRSHGRVEDRLLEYGKKTKEAQEKRQQQRERNNQLQRARMFAPRTTGAPPRSSSAGAAQRSRGTIFEREAAHQRERESNAAAARAAEHQQHSFKPSTNPISATLDANRRRQQLRSGDSTPAAANMSSELIASGDGAGDTSGEGPQPGPEPLPDRFHQLYDEAMKKRQASERRQRSINGSRGEGVLDKPVIDPNSEGLLQKGRNAELFEDDFVTRQQTFEVMRKESMKRAQDREEYAVRQHSGPDRELLDEEEVRDQVERLYYDNIKIAAASKRALEIEVLKEECSFKPALSSGTVAIVTKQEEDTRGRRPGLVDRLSRPRALSERRPADETNTSIASVGSRASCSSRESFDFHEFLERQGRTTERRQARVEKLKAEKEYEELVPCTFRPRLASNRRPSSARPVSRSTAGKVGIGSSGGRGVSGADDYVERQQRARAKRAEQQQRLDDLGKGVPCNGPSYTVVTPFKLSGGRATQAARTDARSPAADKAASRLESSIVRAQDPAPGKQYAVPTSFAQLSTNRMPSKVGMRRNQQPSKADGHADPFTANQLLDAIKQHAQRRNQQNHAVGTTPVTSIYLE